MKKNYLFIILFFLTSLYSFGQCGAGEDNTPPTFTCPSPVTVNLNGACQISIPDLVTGIIDESDNCTTPIVTQSPIAGTLVASGDGTTHNVTISVNDGNGNIATCIVVVTGNDATNPALTAEANQNITLNGSCMATIPNLVDGSTATDNCSGIIITQSPIAGSNQAAIHNGTINVTVTATDAAGNLDSEIVVVTAKDLIAPIITCPTNISVNNTPETCGAVVTYTTPVGTDNCSGAITTQTAGLASGANFPVGITTNTFKVTDAAGLETSCSFTVTVVDNQVPTLTAIAARNENLGTACSFAIPDYTGLTTAADNCTAAGSIIKTQLPVTGTVISGHDTTQLITITADDGNGNTESTTFTITLKDVTAPVTPTLTAVNVGQCGGTPTAPTTTDNCAGTVTGTTATIFPITTQGTTVVTWTFADGNGNSTTANQDVTVDDTIKPTLTAIAARNENLGTACSFAIPDYTGLTTAADNCTAAGSIIKTQLPVSGTVISGHNTTQLITITADDGNGNTESTTFTITLKDVTAPVTPTLTAVNVGQCGGTPTAPTTTDNCAGTVTGTTATIFPITTQGTTVVTWTFADGNGNATTANQNVTVDDTIKPTLTAIAARNENLGTACSFAIPDYTGLTTAADNCTTAGSIIKTQLPVTGTVISGHNTTQLITITADDGNGNTESTTFTITLKDVTAPVTPTLTAVNVGQCSGTPAAPTTTDACAGTITGTTTTTFPITTQGVTVVTWTFSDGNGNATTANQDVTVDDTIKPTLTAIAARNENIVSSCSFTIPDYTGLTTAADNCTTAGSIIKTQLPVSGTVISGHNTTQLITITADDGNGNTESTTFTITLKDVTPPLTPTLANINVGQCSGTPAAPTTTDACAGTITGTTTTTFPITTQGVTVVTWNFSDGNGNSTTANQNITLDDVTKPTLTAIANKNENISTACSFTIPNYTGLTTAADNCTAAGSIIKTQLPISGTVISGHNTTQLITITADDGNGNTESTTFTITLKDVTPPLTPTLANINVGQCSGTPAAPTTTDACAGTITGTTTTTFPITTQGVTVVTWNFSDGNGNSTTANQNITLDDVTKPTLTAIANKNENISTACSFTIPNYTGLTTAADNCTAAGSIIKTQLPVSGTVISGHNTTQLITITADDGNGNTESTTFTITLKDVTPPVITCPATATANTNTDGAGNCTTTVSLGSPTASDNCTTVGNLIIAAKVGGITINPSTYLFGAGNTTVVWTATDQNGNVSTSCNQTVTVTDNENPTIIAPANITTTTNIACTATSVTLGTPVTSDNCSVTSVTNNHPSTTYPLGITTVTWTVTDSSNRTATAAQTVTVTDNVNPTLTQGSNQSATTATGTCTASVVILDAGFSDNCSGATIAYTLSGATTKASTAGQVGTYTFNKGVTTITYTVTDGATPANIFTGTKTVTITDNIKPVAPSLPTINAQCSVTVDFPVATDNCDGSVTATTSDNRTFSSQGNGAIIWSFKDSSNNETIVTQNVVIDDTIAPVPSIASLAPINITNCQIDSLTPPTANDNCKGIITGTTTTPFPITTIGTTVITWTYNDGNGNSSTQNQTVTLTKPAISGGNLLGYVSGLTPAATPSENIAISSCPDDINPITINLSGEIGTIVRWEKFEAGDTAWSVIANTTNSYNIIFDYSNTKSTLFRVLVQVGNCTIYSNMVNVHAIPPDVPPILDQAEFNICLNDSVSLLARSGYTSTVAVGEGGDFNEGQFPDKWDPTQWKIDNVVAGTAWTAAANNTKVNNWTGTNDDKNVGTLYIINYDNGAQGKKFGMAHGNYNSTAYTDKFGVGPTTLETPIFSLVGLQTASVDFDQAFNLHAGDYAKLELSLDGGATYTITLQELIGKNPPLTWDWQNHSPSTASSYKFANDNSTFDISDYIGNDNVRVKWTFFGTTDESVWAIDNITIPVRPYSDQIEWTDGLGNPGEYIVQGNLEVAYTFVPSAPGVHQYGATNLINGCRAYDPDGTALATVKVNYAYAGQAQGYTNAECGERTVSLNAYDNTKSADLNKANGAYPLALNTFSDDPGTGATGTWSVVTASNACGTYSFSDVKSPTSTFSGDEGVYTLRWKLDVSGCYSDVQVTLTSCKVIDFDGVNDYISFKDNYGLGNAFSIEVWVKPDPQPASPPSNIQTIISKRNANSLVDGYDLRLVGSTLSFNWNNGSQITSPFPLTTSRWYHVAVTYTGGIYRLYVDGIEVINAAGSAPISNGFTCLAGAMDQTGNPPNKPVNHFSGWMDELRIWNVGLSSDHVRQMMNQQIINNGTAVRGEIIPIDINGPDANTDGIDDQPLLWSNLNGYYRMDFITCGYLKPFGGKGVDGQLRNITSSQEQTAPLPYVSIRDGNWTDRGIGTTPWKYGDSVWDYPNSTGYNGTPIDWNIVQISNNINSGNKDISLLGLISTAGKLTIADPTVTTPIENNDGQGLWITHYLKLNGNIDLVGESQLVEKRYTPTQFSESILDATSTGFIKRDQQGKKNSFNYNYWSSPVSTIQGSLNNVPYTINNVIKDGTNSATPKTINFGSTFDFADTPTSDPIKTTDRWIWSYNSPIIDGDEWANYFQWYHVTSGGTLKVGEGFTMKGTGGTAPLTVVQNYSFIGKPNSGTITLNLTKDNSYLVGNPYPSALDADEFIKDNLRDCLGCRASVNSFSGALYFWDHFGISDNHNLAEYEGGYATYTLMGGVVAINNSSLNLNDGANGAKIPKRYIPVGQGFFIDGYIDFEVTGSQIPTVVEGGPILFKNSQRVFQRESVSNSVFLKKRETTKTNTNIKQKIRLGFNSSIGAHRQLLVGTDPNTTSLFDIGYDAPMYDTNANDMYWEVGDTQFVIQGIPDFNASRIIPLGIVVANEGVVTLKIDELENVPSSTPIYLHDNQTGMYHDLKNSDFKTTLAVGTYNNRFSLTFESKTTETFLEVAESNSNDGIIVLFSNNYHTLIIRNNDLDSTVNKVSLFNILGQHIMNWDVKDKEQTNIQIPIKNMPSGIYVVKVKTSKGESNKKIIIN